MQENSQPARPGNESTVAAFSPPPSSELALDHLLRALLELGEGTSPAALARHLGWAESALADLLVQARAIGWVAGPYGEPRPAEFVLNNAVVGLDLGGTKLVGAIADLTGRILAQIEEPTRNERDDDSFDQIVDMTGRLVAKAGLEPGALRGIAVGVPGAVSASGKVSLAPNLKIGDSAGLVSRLTGRLGVAARIENDVNVAAFGEYWRGAGRGVPSLAFLALGTGVGMGLLIDGSIYRGESGAAGEIGYLPVGSAALDGAPHSGGGYFEDLVGTEAIRAHYGDGVTVRDIFDRADQGDAKAAEVVARAARDTALGVAGMAMILDPALIVIGGGIGSRGDFAARVSEETHRLAPAACPIVPSALGPRAGLTGAVMLALIDARRAALAKSAA